MTSRDFCFWLQGVLEVGQPKQLNKTQIDIIQKHLNLVFVHEIDPSMGDEKTQTKLNNIHSGKTEELMRC